MTINKDEAIERALCEAYPTAAASMSEVEDRAIEQRGFRKGWLAATANITPDTGPDFSTLPPRITIQSVNLGEHWTANSNKSERKVIGQRSPYDALRLALEDVGCKHITPDTVAIPAPAAKLDLTDYRTRITQTNNTAGFPVVGLPRKELQKAYVQAREDLAHWKRRALAAEAAEQMGSAQAAPAKAEGWQPIETAPKDGRALLLGRAEDEENDRGEISTVGRWHEEDHDGPDNMGHDAGFMDDEFQQFAWGRSFGNSAYMNGGFQPTHWMPLPAAPSTTLGERT